MQTVFLNAVVIDGTGRPPVRGCTVVAENGFITAVGADAVYSDAALVYDLAGMWLLPGLIDAHVHMGGAVTTEGKPIAGADETDMFAESRNGFLSWGVTTVRSGGDFAEDLMSCRDMIEAGELEGPRIAAPGRAFQAAGGHPAFTVWGGGRDVAQRVVVTPVTAEEAREEVRRQAERGFDHIKCFLADDNFPNPGRRAEKLEPGILRAVIDEAHRAGLPVMTHCQQPSFTVEALEAGTDTVEHMMCGAHALEPLPEGLAELFLKTGAVLVPTIASSELYGSPAEVLEAQAEKLKYLYDRGVRLAAGTDCGTPAVLPGESLHRELERMVKAGIPPLDVISIATSGGAAACGRGDVGVIAAGKRADLVAVGSNPLLNISNIRDIRTVVKNGAVIRQK